MTLKEINGLIETGIQENSQLEYKAIEALKDTNEISIDVSAMANAEGGVIIYGVAEFQAKEKKHLPERLDPINLASYNKDSLDRVINSTIHPRIPGVKIDPIDVDVNSFILVVTVPKGETAHQAHDQRYYRRYNFERLKMFDQEIRDVMNRSKSPSVHMKFKILRPDGYHYKVQPYLHNQGRVLARYVRYVYEIPSHFLNVDSQTNDAEGHVKRLNLRPQDFNRFDGTNDISLVVHSGLTIKVEPKKPHILVKGFAEAISTSVGQFENVHIYWTVYADNADKIEGKESFLSIIKGSSLE